MAVATGIIAGVVSLLVNDRVFGVSGDCQYQPDGYTQETVRGQSGVFGPKRMPNPGFISARLIDEGQFSVYTFQGMTGATVVAQLANGKVVSGDGMWVTEFNPVNTEEGTYEVRFEGPTVRETVV